MTPEEYKEILPETQPYTIAYLKDLRTVIDVGVGNDPQHAKECYLENIENMIKLLDEARIKIMYDVDDLTYDVYE